MYNHYLYFLSVFFHFFSFINTSHQPSKGSKSKLFTAAELSFGPRVPFVRKPTTTQLKRLLHSNGWFMDWDVCSNPYIVRTSILRISARKMTTKQFISSKKALLKTLISMPHLSTTCMYININNKNTLHIMQKINYIQHADWNWWP